MSVENEMRKIIRSAMAMPLAEVREGGLEDLQERAAKLLSDYAAHEAATQKQRADAAEAKLERVGEYATYYVLAWELFDENEAEPEPLDFAEWLTQRSEAQP